MDSESLFSTILGTETQSLNGFLEYLEEQSRRDKIKKQSLGPQGVTEYEVFELRVSFPREGTAEFSSISQDLEKVAIIYNPAPVTGVNEKAEEISCLANCLICFEEPVVLVNFEIDGPEDLKTLEDFIEMMIQAAPGKKLQWHFNIPPIADTKLQQQYELLIQKTEEHEPLLPRSARPIMAAAAAAEENLDEDVTEQELFNDDASLAVRNKSSRPLVKRDTAGEKESKPDLVGDLESDSVVSDATEQRVDGEHIGQQEVGAWQADGLRDVAASPAPNPKLLKQSDAASQDFAGVSLDEVVLQLDVPSTEAWPHAANYVGAQRVGEAPHNSPSRVASAVDLYSQRRLLLNLIYQKSHLWPAYFAEPFEQKLLTGFQSFYQETEGVGAADYRQEERSLAPKSRRRFTKKNPILMDEGLFRELLNKWDSDSEFRHMLATNQSLLTDIFDHFYFTQEQQERLKTVWSKYQADIKNSSNKEELGFPTSYADWSVLSDQLPYGSQDFDYSSLQRDRKFPRDSLLGRAQFWLTDFASSKKAQKYSFTIPHTPHFLAQSGVFMDSDTKQLRDKLATLEQMEAAYISPPRADDLRRRGGVENNQDALSASRANQLVTPKAVSPMQKVLSAGVGLYPKRKESYTSTDRRRFPWRESFVSEAHGPDTITKAQQVVGATEYVPTRETTGQLRTEIEERKLLILIINRFQIYLDAYSREAEKSLASAAASNFSLSIKNGKFVLDEHLLSLIKNFLAQEPDLYEKLKVSPSVINTLANYFLIRPEQLSDLFMPPLVQVKEQQIDKKMSTGRSSGMNLKDRQFPADSHEVSSGKRSIESSLFKSSIVGKLKKEHTLFSQQQSSQPLIGMKRRGLGGFYPVTARGLNHFLLPPSCAAFLSKMALQRAMSVGPIVLAPQTQLEQEKKPASKKNLLTSPVVWAPIAMAAYAFLANDSSKGQVMTCLANTAQVLTRSIWDLYAEVSKENALTENLQPAVATMTK